MTSTSFNRPSNLLWLLCLTKKPGCGFHRDASRLVCVCRIPWLLRVVWTESLGVSSWLTEVGANGGCMKTGYT